MIATKAIELIQKNPGRVYARPVAWATSKDERQRHTWIGYMRSDGFHNVWQDDEGKFSFNGFLGGIGVQDDVQWEIIEVPSDPESVELPIFNSLIT